MYTYTYSVQCSGEVHMVEFIISKTKIHSLYYCCGRVLLRFTLGHCLMEKG